ncbi:MAG: 3-dehydroquinate synthase [Anaerolineae bacterium]
MTRETDSRNLILTGFMGTGKSTIGRRVAERIGRLFVDMDELIVARAGMSIPEIFARLGEPAFRQMEAGVCRELAGQSGLVIATGGGTLINPANRRLMESGGRVVCLWASPETVIERLAGEHGRPLLNAPDPLAEARRILEQRRAVYSSFPWQVDTTGRSIEEVVEAVIRIWRARVLNMQLPDSGYDIYILEGALEHAGLLIRRLGDWSRVVIVSNPTVWKFYGERLRTRLEVIGLSAVPALIPDGESFKTLETVAELYERFLDAGLDRAGLVVALGGGVVGDAAGFAAATYMRGVSFVQVPTTLLAMIDASVGGKTGVDLPRGKNLVGAFHQPRLVIIDPLVLESLPPAQIRQGLSEALKAAIIADAGLFDILAAGPPWPWPEVIARALQVKIDVVQRDPHEQGWRAVLNLGHTAGHALERLSGYAMPHGEAVAVGMMVATHIAEIMGYCAPALVGRISSALQKLGLPIRWPGTYTPEQVLEAMGSDKKRRHGRMRWILPRDIGKVEIVEDVPAEAVLEALRRTCITA